MSNVEKIIIEVAKENNIKFDITKKDVELKHLKIDSLAAMNLIIQIEERLSKTLEDDVLISIKTLDDLIKAFS
ncbi:MAG: phosphopantetheine-binding protein [Mycoplasma sp.]